MSRACSCVRLVVHMWVCAYVCLSACVVRDCELCACLCGCACVCVCAVGGWVCAGVDLRVFVASVRVCVCVFAVHVCVHVWAPARERARVIIMCLFLLLYPAPVPDALAGQVEVTNPKSLKTVQTLTGTNINDL